MKALGVVNGVDEVCDFRAGVVDFPESLAVDLFGFECLHEALVGDTQHWATNRPSHSKPKWLR